MIAPKQPQTNINLCINHAAQDPCTSRSKHTACKEYFPPRDKNKTPKTPPHMTVNKNATPKTPPHTTFKKPRVGGTPNRSECAQGSEDEDEDDASNFKELDKEDASGISTFTS
jgi:hypothetical protein